MLEPVLAFARVALAERRRPRPSPMPAEHHLLAAEAWLCRAHDANRDGGVSYGYSIRGGWRPSYPETSGYIATTFFRLARDRDPAYLERGLAHRRLAARHPEQRRLVRQSALWSRGDRLRHRSGAVRARARLRTHRRSGDARGARAVPRRWLTRIADSDLRWTRNEHLGVPHVYNTRTAWALLRMNQVEPDRSRASESRVPTSTGPSPNSSRTACSSTARSSPARRRSPTRSPTRPRPAGIGISSGRTPLHCWPPSAALVRSCCR